MKISYISFKDILEPLRPPKIGIPSLSSEVSGRVSLGSGSTDTETSPMHPKSFQTFGRSSLQT